MKSMLLKNKFTAALLISVATSALIWLLDPTGLPDLINRKGYDAAFCCRALLQPPEPAAPMVMLDVDDRTLADPAFQKPMALWHEDFSQVIDALSEGGARVIGLDYLLPSVLFDDAVEGYSQAWRRAFIRARGRGTAVVAGFIQNQDRQIAPHKNYILALGADNVGFFNLTPDGDGVVRRQRLVIPTQSGDPLHSFGYRLFQAANPDAASPPAELRIDFLSPDRFFPRYSFSEVYRKVREGDLLFLNRRFKDKIVIMGAVDSMSHDRYPTPLHLIDGRRTPGVDIHANVVHTLYGNRFFQPASGVVRAGVYFVLALGACLMAGFLPVRYAAVGLSVLAVAYFGACVYGLIHYTVFPVSSGFAAIPAGLIIWFGLRYLTADKDLKRLDHRIRMFLTPHVADGMLKLKDTELLTGKKMRLCILFSDIRGFTTYSQKTDDLEVVARLNEYYGPMSEAIAREGGVVSRFFGDGLLAFFGAFETTKNPSLAGVRAALNMVKQLDALNHDWRAAGKETFRIGVGLHTGKVAFGGIGSTKKIEFTLTGDAANLASRVESKTKELNETIVISEDVFKDVQGRLPATIQFEDKGLQPIKGRGPIRLYALKLSGQEEAS